VTVHFVPEDRAAEPARAVPADRDVPGEPGIPSPQGGGTVRVAYAVGRPTGSAVVRNRYRRRLRVITAEFAPELPPGAYLVRLAPDVARLGFEELRERVRTSMRAASRSGR
jgi:RNase P protein component